jgi:DNA-binding NarL/FixJ family response regulator
MSAGEDGGRPLSVLLCGGRKLRRECLAEFLELKGVPAQMIALENGGQDAAAALAGASAAAALAIIDAGEKSCSDPAVEKLFDDLRSAIPGIAIVVISDREDGSAVVDAIRLGARAYFPSSLDLKILVETLRFVQNGGTFVPPSALIGEYEPQRLPPAAVSAMRALGITGRELRVLELLQKGHSNKAIARELDIEEGTVKVHVHRILGKLNAHNRTEAALRALQMAEADGRPGLSRWADEPASPRRNLATRPDPVR